jgi:hypothetical protein
MRWVLAKCVVNSPSRGLTLQFITAMQTLQTIAFNAYLRERHVYDPFLVVCPLSVLHNWAEEFKKFAPSVRKSQYL